MHTCINYPSGGAPWHPTRRWYTMMYLMAIESSPTKTERKKGIPPQRATGWTAACLWCTCVCVCVCVCRMCLPMADGSNAAYKPSVCGHDPAASHKPCGRTAPKPWRSSKHQCNFIWLQSPNCAVACGSQSPASATNGEERSSPARIIAKEMIIEIHYTWKWRSWVTYMISK